MDTSQVCWRSLFFEGIVFCLLGLFALTHPYVIALSLNILLGSLLTIGGVIQGVRALKAGTFPVLIAALVSLIVGLLLLFNPMAGVLTLTFLLTAYFFIDGVIKVLSSLEFRPVRGWGWLFFSGLVSILLGVFVVSQWPTSAVWVLGVYLGIYMLFLGVSLMTISCYGKKESS